MIWRNITKRFAVYKHKSYCWVLHNLKDLVSHKGITFVAHFMKYNEI